MKFYKFASCWCLLASSGTVTFCAHHVASRAILITQKEIVESQRRQAKAFELARGE